MANRVATQADHPDDPRADETEQVSSQELDLSDRDFDELRAVIRDLTGISLADSKRQMVYRRVAGRLRELAIGSFKEYCAYLRSGDPVELEQFTNAVTTNLTSFFREKHHFDYLVTTVLPEIVERKRAGNRKLRIWSAGCSTGEEPYSIAITLRESFPSLQRWDAKILATDLDSDVLATCRAGIYAKERVAELPQARRKRWFLNGKGKNGDIVRVRPELQELITFKQLNLMQDWPMRGRFDLIFCRNVIIYFDKATQKVLIDRYAELLEDGGHLFLGHSESLFNVSERFSLLGKTIYRKTG